MILEFVMICPHCGSVPCPPIQERAHNRRADYVLSRVSQVGWRGYLDVEVASVEEAVSVVELASRPLGEWVAVTRLRQRL
jgi:hypothetical protein